MNQFEARNRALKVNRLVRHISELFDLLGLHAESDGVFMADLLRGWGDKEWNAACVNIGVKPQGNKPLCSIVTRLAVLAHFVDAQKARAS